MSKPKKPPAPPPPMPIYPVEELGRSASIDDPSDPDSIISRSPDSLADAIRTKLRHDIVGASETKLKEVVKPDSRLARLRISFWDEYGRAVEQDRTISLEMVCSGVVHKEYIYQVMGDSMKLSYMLNHPTHYDLAVKQIHLSGIDRLFDIIELPIVTKKGEPNVSVINAIIKIVQMLDDRVKGKALERRAVHEHHTSDGTIPVSAVAGSGDDEVRYLNEQLAKIKQKLDHPVFVEYQADALIEDE